MYENLSEERDSEQENRKEEVNGKWTNTRIEVTSENIQKAQNKKNPTNFYTKQLSYSIK